MDPHEYAQQTAVLEAVQKVRLRLASIERKQELLARAALFLFGFVPCGLMSTECVAIKEEFNLR